jgi:CelD/BcsL family acetyltransferase involved in cellulose biosynthesis
MIQVSRPDAQIQDFLAQYASDHFYFHPAWLEILTSLYGYTPIYLTATNSSGKLSGFLPLCSMHSPLTGRRLVSLPFSDYCPLLAEDEASANQLVDQAIELARQKRVRYLELRAGLNEVLARREDLAAGNLYTRWLVSLAPDPDLAWARLRPTARRKVKHARKQGVQIRLAEKREEMHEYYRLHLLTRTKKHGMPAQPLAFFLRLWDAFAPGGQLHLELAEYQGQVIAAHITALVGTGTRYLYGASDERFHELGAGYLLTWEAIARGGKLGYQQLDLGRTAYESPGLMQFKRSWGSCEQASPYYYFPAIAGLASTPESSRTYRVLTTCWRRLPLQISTPLGGYLYRHLG